jgi:hypothetical protein
MTSRLRVLTFGWVCVVCGVLGLCFVSFVVVFLVECL